MLIEWVAFSFEKKNNLLWTSENDMIPTSVLINKVRSNSMLLDFMLVLYIVSLEVLNLQKIELINGNRQLTKHIILNITCNTY